MPPFLPAGEGVDLELVAPDTATSITLTFSGDAEPVSATVDPATGKWHAAVLAPASLAGTAVTLTITATTTDGTTLVSDQNVTVLDTAPITPEPSSEQFERIVEAPWGNAPGEIGRLLAVEEGLDSGPTAIAVDPATGHLLIVDDVNARLAVLDPATGTFSAVDLPADGTLVNVVPHGATGRATVINLSRQPSGEPTTTAYIVDLRTLTYVAVGPAEIPAGTPANLEYVWNPADQIIYARVGTGWQPHLDTTTATLLVDRPAIEGPGPFADQTRGSGWGYHGPELSVHLGTGSYAVTTVAPPEAGILWTLVDHQPADSERGGILLTRIDINTHTATAVDLDVRRYYSLETASRVIVASDHSAYFMYATDTGLALDSINL